MEQGKANAVVFENVSPLPKRQPDGIVPVPRVLDSLSLSLPAESGTFFCVTGGFFCGGDVMACSG